MLAPNGQDWLTKASRGPQMVLGRSAGAESLSRFALAYPAKADLKEAIVQDFHSFRQGLNVASADQRVMVLVNAPAGREEALRISLRAVASDERVIGRFHFDFEQGDQWKEKIAGTHGEHGIVLIHPGEFGMTGKVLAQLPLDSSAEQIVLALEKANKQFAATSQKKVYSEHVAKGRKENIYFEGAVPYGEDRDGDGKVDRGGGRRSSRRGR